MPLFQLTFDKLDKNWNEPDKTRKIKEKLRKFAKTMEMHTCYTYTIIHGHFIKKHADFMLKHLFRPLLTLSGHQKLTTRVFV